MREKIRLVGAVRRGSLRASLTAVLLTTGACGALRGCHWFDKPAARCERRAGTVSVSDAKHQAPLEQGGPIFDGQVVTTGPDGRASLTFASGQSIDVEPNTSLVVHRAGGTAAQFGAVLISGGFKARGAGASVAFQIGTPFGLVALEGTDTELDVSSASGLTVLVGAVSFAGDGGLA
ncbi:MAG: FecR domain-containing protein, partial [Myxococcota bacterium]